MSDGATATEQLDVVYMNVTFSRRHLGFVVENLLQQNMTFVAHTYLEKSPKRTLLCFFVVSEVCRRKMLAVFHPRLHHT